MPREPHTLADMMKVSSSRRAGWTLNLCAALSLPCACLGFPTFPALIPNGLRVPCPSHFDKAQSVEQCALDICKGVGHVDCRGGDFPETQGELLNAFGKAFQAAGRQWTSELCNEDSDGDGKTNGQELGDPCCVWQPAALPTVGAEYRISHPGHAEDVTDSLGPTPAECQALQQSIGAAAAFDKDGFVDGLYNPGEDRLNLTFRVQEHTLQPNETVYTEVFFPLDVEEDLYVVGFMADVRNAVHLHHFVVYLCKNSIDQLYDPPREAGFPQHPPSEAANGRQVDSCQENFYNWAPGGDTMSLPKNMAMKLGKEDGFKALYLQMHYNNPNGDTDAKDSSAFIAYATSKPREHDLAVWWSGSVIRIGDIPPGRAAYFNSGECRVSLTNGCSEIKVLGAGPHAHFLGTAVWTELYRPDEFGALTYVGDIAREDAFNYELQRFLLLPEEVTVRDGDVVTTTCVFDSMDRTEATSGGLASSQEMCINFLTVYPAECLPRSECLTFGRAVSGDVPSDIKPPYHAPSLYAIGGSANFSAIAAAGLATCDVAAVFSNTALSSSAPLLEQVLTSFTEACPGTINRQAPDNLLTPQEALTYECRPECVQWLINMGVCIVTDLKTQYDLLTSSSEASFLDPAVLAPPACHEAVARNLTESSGGIFRRPEVPQESTKSGAAGSVQAPFYATFWAAQAFAMVFASLYA